MYSRHLTRAHQTTNRSFWEQGAPSWVLNCLRINESYRYTTCQLNCLTQFFISRINSLWVESWFASITHNPYIYWFPPFNNTHNMTDEPHRKTSPHWWIFSEQSNEGKSSGYSITTLHITITAKLSWESDWAGTLFSQIRLATIRL